MGRSLVRAAADVMLRRSIDTVTYNGVRYPLFPLSPQPTLGFKQEDIKDTFTDYARFAHQSNAVVYALMERRRQLFSQAHFRFQRLVKGVPGEFTGGPGLDLLDGPGRTDSAQDLMSQAITDADLAGTAVIIRESGRLTCLRPDWVTIVAGSRGWPEQGVVAADAEVVGILYWPGGKHSGADPVAYLPGEFTLFRYTPDPTFRFKGVSWIKPAIQEILGDSAATIHKKMFFENGATPSTIVSLDPSITPDQFVKWKEVFERDHTGAANAYKTLYLGGGADVEVVGATLRQIDFKMTQGAGETRLAAASGVPPIIGGLSEGLAAATYSNYGQARRAYSDLTMWDLWGKMSNALEAIIPPPKGSRMWVDGTGIPFLQDDATQDAEVIQVKAAAMRQLVDGGWDPESVTDAVNSGDLSRLVHTGNLSVQLQDPNAKPPEPPAEAPPTEQVQQVENARAALVARGISRPTQEAIAAELGVSERTVQRWMSHPVV